MAAVKESLERGGQRWTRWYSEVMNNAATTVRITRSRLEAGSHLLRTVAETLEVKTVDIPTAEISELRPDFGVYVDPIVTFSAIERALRVRGEIFPIPSDQVWRYGVVEVTS